MGRKAAPRPKHMVFQNVTTALPLETNHSVVREGQWDFNTISWPQRPLLWSGPGKVQLQQLSSCFFMPSKWHPDISHSPIYFSQTWNYLQNMTFIYTIKLHIKCSKGTQHKIKQRYIDLELYLLAQIRFLGARFTYKLILSYCPSVSSALSVLIKQSLPLSLKFTLDMPAVLAIRAGEAHCSCFPLSLLYRNISHWGPKRQNTDWVFFFFPKWFFFFIMLSWWF